MTLNVPPVDRFPAVAVPVTVSEVSEPTEVIFGCAAVVSVPAKKLAVARLPKLALPDVTLPEILAATAKTVLFATKLLATILPASVIVALSPPVVKKLMYPAGPAARYIPVPPSTIIGAFTLPTVFKLPPVTFPVTESELNVPTDVMLG